MKGAFLPILRCEAVVYRRDGRPCPRCGRQHPHLIRGQCLRRHAKDSRFCWQHARAAEKP